MTTPLVLLLNFVAPYRLPLFRAVDERVPGTEFWVSVETESDRAWKVDADGLRVRRMPGITLSARRLRRRPYDLHVPIAGLPMLLRHRPDVVVTAEMGARTMAAVAYRRTNPHSRLVVWATLSERSERNVSPTRSRIRRRLLAAADAVLVNSESGARYVRTLRPDVPISVIGQATPDRGVRAPAYLDGDVGRELRLVHVGRLVEGKGLAEAIDELERWSARSDRTVTLTLVGDGVLREALAERAAASTLHVVLTGSVGYDDVPDVMAQHDGLLFPSWQEEWGLVVNEALQTGLPVIGSIHSPAAMELVVENVNGALFDPLVPGELADAVDRAVALLPRGEDLVRACRTTVAAMTIERMADRIVRTCAQTTRR